jgi:diguanylate cyclase (GGDEF)-like protein
MAYWKYPPGKVCMRDPTLEPVALVVSGEGPKTAFFKRILKGQFCVIEASDSLTAVEWLKKTRAALVIIDEKTLSSTWSILVDHIRKGIGNKETPILLITNNLKKNFLIDAMNMGVSDFINEPLQADEILQRILVATQSRPVTKKISLMTRKIKKKPSSPPGKLSLPERFVVTEEAIKEISTVQKQHLSLCLLLVEVDDFEQITGGDRESEEKLIKHIEKYLHSHLRKLDTLFPQGTGRFLMLLPKTSHRAAMVIAETVRKEIRNHKFSNKNATFTLSMSIGLIALDKNSASTKSAYDQFDSLLTKVNKALKNARQSGNKIVSESSC